MSFEIREATQNDAGDLARLVNMAGEGMPFYLWENSVENGAVPWEHGRKRAITDGVGFNYRNSNVAVIDGKVVGSIAHYPLSDTVEPLDPDTPDIFVPLLELEAQAPGTHYTNVLAVDPNYRGQGIGQGLLDYVLTTETNRDHSLIVENANKTAISLYQKLGFRKVMSRQIVDGGWGASGDEYVLMIRRHD